MKFTKYGIILRRVVESDIELIRTWRNSENVRNTMQFREYITPEMQQQWFEKINTNNSLYYIIEYNNRAIGLVNDKSIDWKKRTSEAGLFIWDSEFQNDIVPLLVSVCCLDTSFFFLSWKGFYATILKSNVNALEYNKTIGYERVSEDENLENEVYFLTSENYYKKIEKIKNSIKKLTPQNTETTYLLLEEDDYKTGIAQLIECILENHPQKIPYILINNNKVYYYPEDKLDKSSMALSQLLSNS